MQRRNFIGTATLFSVLLGAIQSASAPTKNGVQCSGPRLSRRGAFAGIEHE